MKWRKVIALLLVLVTAVSVLSVSGCGKAASSNKEEEADVSSDSDEDEGTNTVDNEKGYYTAEDYLADPSLFTPVWADEWTPPAELTNFEEKWESWFDPDGRLMSLVHRAEGNTYYPENSVEAVLSCIAAGADMIEIDLCVTKDGHYVLMHDKNIVRTTNVTTLRHEGAVGLPESDTIADWTLEQLRRLRLVMLKEDGTKVVTNYVIPTLDDVLMVAADKIFIMLDLDTTDYDFDFEKDIYPLIKKYNAYRSVGLPFTMIGSYSEDHINELIETIKKDSGHDKVMMQFGASETNVANVVQMIEENNWPKFLRGGSYNYSLDKVFEPYFGKYRVHTNAILSDIDDNRANWEMLHEKGYNFIHTDYYVEMSKYIAELYFSN